MTTKRKALYFLLIQMALVLSIAAKYAWERHHCPTVWTRTVMFDPDQPLRGRYLSLTLRVNACRVIGEPVKFKSGYDTWVVHGKEATLADVAGVLTAIPTPAKQIEKESIEIPKGTPCEAGILNGQVEYFIAEHAKSPFPLKKGTELWALVTVPPSGPPRPVQLAISGPDGFHPLDLR